MTEKYNALEQKEKNEKKGKKEEAFLAAGSGKTQRNSLLQRVTNNGGFD